MKVAMPTVFGMVLALGVAGAADAQRMVQHGPGASFPPPGPQVGTVVHHPPLPPAPVQGRWGSRIGGRWWGGANAPGGWAAYRQPQRGWRVPSYWIAPRFYVTDWNYYGFATPRTGYNWVRYYDDAVLIDERGEVQDSVYGVDWDRIDRDGGWERADRERRDRNGVGGAVAGAVVGGVAGNLIAGRGDKLGGTLIGAGVGAAAGYAVGSARDRDARRGPPPPPPPGLGYREPLPPPPPPMRHEERIERHVYGPGPGYPPPGPSSWSDGRTTVTVTTSGGAAPVVYAPPPPPAYGYGYGPMLTTITVQTAPVVTTTTTEIVEDSVTWTRPVVRKVYRKRLWRAPTKLCRCR